MAPGAGVSDDALSGREYQEIGRGSPFFVVFFLLAAQTERKHLPYVDYVRRIMRGMHHPALSCSGSLVLARSPATFLWETSGRSDNQMLTWAFFTSVSCDPLLARFEPSA